MDIFDSFMQGILFAGANNPQVHFARRSIVHGSLRLRCLSLQLGSGFEALGCILQ